MRESLRKERLAEDVDQVWGVVWSWILPSSEDTKAVVVEAMAEAAERGDPDIDDMRRVVDVWMNIAVLETAASDFASAFQQFKDLVTKQVESGEERSQEAVLEREKLEISIAERLAGQLLRQVDGYETITQVVAKTLNKSMGEDLAERIVKLGENITNGEDFFDRVALATREPEKSEWDPKGGPEVVKASRESLLRSRNLPEVLAQYTYDQLPAALYSYYVLMLAGSSLLKMGVAINIEAYRITGGESEAVGFSTVGSGDISGGKSKGGMLTAFKKDERRSGVISGTAEKYEMAVLSVLDMEKSAGAKNKRAVVSAYEKIVVPKIPKGGNNREMASQSTAYIAAMREFLTLYGADFDADKRTEKAASRLSAKEASKGPGPKMTPNRALTPNLAPLRSSALMEPSLRLLPGIRINPIALILALYA